MKDNFFKYLSWALIAFVIILFAVVTMMGCSTAKKEAKTIGYVAARPDLQDKISRLLFKAPDTIIVTTERIVHDTLLIDNSELLASLKQVAVTEQDIKAFFEKLVFFTTRNIDTTLPNGIRLQVTADGITATTTHKSTQRTITDRKEAEYWRTVSDTLRMQMVSIYAERDQLRTERDQLRAAVKELTKKPKSFPWWIIGVAIAIVGVLAFLYKSSLWGRIIQLLKLLPKLLAMLSRKKKTEGTTPVSNTNSVTMTGWNDIVMPRRKGKIIYAKVGKEWQWQAIYDNGEASSTSEPYKTKRACLHGINSFQIHDFDEVTEVKKLNKEL